MNLCWFHSHVGKTDSAATPGDLSHALGAGEDIKAFVWTCLILVLLFGLRIHSMGHGQFAAFRVGRWTVNVHAEGDFHDGPPGYLYFVE